VKESRNKLKKRCEILKMAELSYHKNFKIFSNSDVERTLAIPRESSYLLISVIS
jgi:hypothetical protein